MRHIFKIWGIFFVCALAGYFAARLAGISPAYGQIPSQSTPTVQTPAAQIAQQMQGMKEKESVFNLKYRSISFIGLFVLIGLCVVMSNNRSKINWSLVGWGLALQFIFGILVLETKPGLWLFSELNDLMLALLNFTEEGTRFLFSSFVTGKIEPSLSNLIFHVLPSIIFFSSLMTIGYHLGVMQWIVKAFAYVMHKTMCCSGAETLSTAANIFVGQTEAPLVVKPFIEKMTQSELMAVMVGGFANTAGGVLAAYVGMLHPYFPSIAGHLIAQSVMSAPATLVCAKIIFPETEPTVTGESIHIPDERPDANLIDAAARGASEGMGLTINVAAMLLAFIALIAMANAILRKFSLWIGFPGITLESILGVPGTVFAFVMGVPWNDCWEVGKLLGMKTVLNEFVAYLRMAQMLQNGTLTTYRSVVITSYALSSFANFGSIAIQIGGIAGMAPSRRHDLARLGLKAMITGAIATFMTANIAGILIN